MEDGLLRQHNVGQLIDPISEVISASAASLVPQTIAGGVGVRVDLSTTAANPAAARQEQKAPGDDAEPADSNGIRQHETSLSKRPG